MDGVEELTAALGETEPKVQRKLGRFLGVLGPQRASALVEQARAIHAGEGLWFRRDDQQIRRTLGGCFFALAKEGMSRPERRAARSRGGGPDADLKPLKWGARIALLRQAAAEGGTPGKVAHVKIVITGRPDQVIEPPGMNAVLVLLQHEKKPGNLPKGLPMPEKASTPYAVYIAMKQWRKVRDRIKDPQDVLVIEGHPIFDEAFSGITVMAISTSTKKIKLEQAKKLQQAQA